MDLSNEFLLYLRRPELCELFYNYMKTKQLAHILEFYLVCDGLKTSKYQKKEFYSIIKLIYKNYLSSNRTFLSKTIYEKIQQQINQNEFHSTIYDQAKEFTFDYMLKTYFPKFLNQTKLKRQIQ